MRGDMVRQNLFVGGEGGYHTYRIPSLVTTAEGVVLAFCEGRRLTGRDDDETDLLLRRSVDGGVTWEPSEVVVADGARTCGNPCPVVEGHTGIVWLPFCKDNREVWITHSHDEGLTWAEPVEITQWAVDPSWTYVGTGPGHGIQLESGRLLIPCWCDESPPPPNGDEMTWGQVQSSYALFSDDGGVTWWRSEMLSRDASDECEAVETNTGLVYMTLRSRQGQRVRGVAWSQDGGASWSDVEYDGRLPGCSCQGSIARLDESRVVLAYPSDPRERQRLAIRLSEDECASWPVERVLEEGYSGYSDLAVTAAGEALCLYEAAACGKLVLARFGVEWITGESA